MSGPVVKNHILSTMAETSNATQKTMNRSLSQDYQHVLPVRLQVPLLHRQRRTQPKIPRQVLQQYGAEVPAVHQLRDSKQLLGDSGDTDPVQGYLLRDLPEWLEDFAENPVDEGVSASRDTRASTSHDSDSERPAKVVASKHSIFVTHFPKDRNYEVCKRTKTPRAPYKKRTGDAVFRAENFDLMKADHTKFSAREVNLGTITDTQSCVKLKLFRRRKGLYESFSSRRKSQKPLIVTVH